MNFITAYKLLIVVLVFALFSSCQEDPVAIGPEHIDSEVDQEMLDAESQADAFLESLAAANGRRSKRNDRSVTNLRFKKDELLFKTKKVTKGYEPIDEMTVTAEGVAGSYLFWHAGGGVKEIEGIEFDAASLKHLEHAPFLVNRDLWVARIKNNDEDEDEDDEDDEDDEFTYLKYDIIYKTKESGESPIRLDPKVKFRHK